jgi:hypothetical protein
MFASKQRTSALFAAGALALGIPAAGSAAITLPGFLGGTQGSSGAIPVSNITAHGFGVLGADGPLGKNGPLGGKGCVAAGVNPNSLGPDGPLGPKGPLGPGGSAANLAGCSSSGSSSGMFGFGFGSFGLFANQLPALNGGAVVHAARRGPPPAARFGQGRYPGRRRLLRPAP